MAGTGGKRPGAGRKPGSVSKINKLAKQVLGDRAKQALEPLVDKAADFTRNILDGKVPCGVCFGKGKTRYQAAHGGDRTFERTCMSCYGSKFERLSPETRLRAALDLLQYGHSKRTAVDLTNSDGSLKPTWVVKMPDTSK